MYRYCPSYQWNISNFPAFLDSLLGYKRCWIGAIILLEVRLWRHKLWWVQCLCSSTKEDPQYPTGPTSTLTNLKLASALHDASLCIPSLKICKVHLLSSVLLQSLEEAALPAKLWPPNRHQSRYEPTILINSGYIGWSIVQKYWITQEITQGNPILWRPKPNLLSAGIVISKRSSTFVLHSWHDFMGQSEPCSLYARWHTHWARHVLALKSTL